VRSAQYAIAALRRQEDRGALPSFVLRKANYRCHANVFERLVRRQLHYCKGGEALPSTTRRMHRPTRPHCCTDVHYLNVTQAMRVGCAFETS